MTLPEIGATKTASTLDSALTITLHDIVKHLTTRSLILVLTDHYVERDGQSADPQECPPTDLEHQGAISIAQLGIARKVKRRERHLVFELSRPLTREQSMWLDEHVGQLFESCFVKNDI